MLKPATAAGCLVVCLTGNASPQEAATNTYEDLTMSQTTTAIASTYYGAFQGEHAVADIPMREDLLFVSPRFTLNSAAAFRGALTGLFQQVKGLEISAQLQEGETVVTFYELDLGAPGGPIPMAERLRVENGALTRIDLIFDSARLPADGEAAWKAPGPDS